jgi:3'-phosphoadenosine 5'-phosphosulfate (PAPS) 3'-phosphatase
MQNLGTDKFLKTTQLVSVILSLFKRATKLFYEYKSGEFIANINVKAKDEKFTDADYIIQKMFENNMNKYFPGLKIIGEEDTTTNLIPESKYYTTDEVDFDILKENQIEDQLEEELCLFIDPIDSTEQFIKKNFNPVTSLVGITKNSKPFMGFIHYPLYEGKENNSLTFFNIPSKGIFSHNIFTNEINQVSIRKRELNEWAFVSSGSRTNQKMLNVFDLFENSSTVKASGLGNKAIGCVLDDQVFLSSGKSKILKIFYKNFKNLILNCLDTGLWDVCAGHCLVKEI